MNRRSLIGLVLVALAALNVAGCSAPYGEAALPLAEPIHADIVEYTEGAGAVFDASTVWITHVRDNDRVQAVEYWTGVNSPNGISIRDAYVTFLNSDDSLSTPDGLIVRGILLRNVRTMDYVNSVGVPAE